MGYKPPSTGLKLDFSDTQYAGLEITMGSISLGQLLKIEALSETRDVQGLVALFAEVMESWNVDDDHGDPVPADRDGVLSQDPDFVLAVIQVWEKTVTSAPPPLPGGSGSGGTSEEESTLALASASASLPS